MPVAAQGPLFDSDVGVDCVPLSPSSALGVWPLLPPATLRSPETGRQAARLFPPGKCGSVRPSSEGGCRENRAVLAAPGRLPAR